jgi:hypothetical protein
VATQGNEGRRLTPIERAIVDAVRRAVEQGLEPRSIYLTGPDYRRLRRVDVDGLPVRAVAGKGRSKLYCRHGIARAIGRGGQA